MPGGGDPPGRASTSCGCPAPSSWPSRRRPLRVPSAMPASWRSAPWCGATPRISSTWPARPPGGLNAVAVAHALPVGFGVLTVDTMQQAVDRAGETRATRATKRPPPPFRLPMSSRSFERSMLRPETKSRARALQLLYAWELLGEPPVPSVATGLSRLTGPEPRILDRAEELAQGVIAEVGQLDADAEAGERQLAAQSDGDRGAEYPPPRHPRAAPR